MLWLRAQQFFLVVLWLGLIVGLAAIFQDRAQLSSGKLLGLIILCVSVNLWWQRRTINRIREQKARLAAGNSTNKERTLWQQ
jgi:hypothetical protein